MLIRATPLALLLTATIGMVPAGADGQSKASSPLAIGDAFPRLEAEFLTGRKAVLPDAAAGKAALVMMGFTYDSRYEVEKWAEHVQREFGTNEGVTFACPRCALRQAQGAPSQSRGAQMESASATHARRPSAQRPVPSA